MGKYRIMCFDGGGIKGALTIKILQMLNDSIPGLLNNVNMFAGTSTGGIIALGMAKGMEPNKIVDLYVNNGARIFDPFEVPFFEKWERGIGKPKYDNIKLKELLSENFGSDSTLQTLYAKVLVNTLQLNLNNNWVPVQLTNFEKSEFRNMTLVDAALRTSAAPTFFPSYQGFIDGGVFANNPSTIALAMALDECYGDAELNDIRMLSFGTGYNPDCIKGDVHWGALQWMDPFGSPATPLISILMDGVQEVDTYQCMQILGSDRYCRINPMLDKSFGMDDWKNVDYLIDFAENYPKNKPKEWEKITAWIKEYFVI
jgi:uncharacterized protein